MMKNLLLLSCIAVLLCSCRDRNETVTAVHAEAQKVSSDNSDVVSLPFNERKYSLMEREIEYLMAAWPGVYDNVEQTSYEKDISRTKAPTTKIMRSHSTITKLKAEEGAEYLLLFQSYMDNNPDNIYIASIGQLTPMDDEGKIKIAMHPLDMDMFKKAPDRIGYAQSQVVNSLKSVKPNEFMMRRNGDTFLAKGIINEKEVKIRLNKDQLWVSPPKDAPLEDDWLIMEKARCFTCMVDFPRVAGGHPGNTIHYVDIYDQGGQFQFEYDPTLPKQGTSNTMMLSIRKTWSYGMHRESLAAVLQTDNLDGKTLAYSWSDPEADRIGFNTGWIRIQCDLKTDDNVKFQQWLRPDS